MPPPRLRVSCGSPSARAVMELACAETPGWTLVPEKDADIVWESSPRRVREWLLSEDPARSLAPHVRLSHLPGASEAFTKVQLGLWIEWARKLSAPERYAFAPETFVLPEELEQLQTSMSASKRTTFIVKPDEGSQGDGIFLIQDPRQVEDRILRYGGGRGVVAQRYLDDPLLVDGKKFDLRLYALVTAVRPLRVYACREGLARFCTKPYAPPSSRNLHDVCGHLTNYSLNKHSSDFTHSNDASGGDSAKRTVSAVFKALSDQGYHTEQLWDNIHELMVHTLQALAPILTEQSLEFGERSRQCFHIVGFDVMLDSEGRPWLIELNANPSFSIDAVFSPEQFADIHGRDAVDAALGKASNQAPISFARKERIQSGMVTERGDSALPTLRVCRCMDSSGPHFHEPSPVDVHVKKQVVRDAFEILRRERRGKPTVHQIGTFTRICGCDMEGEADDNGSYSENEEGDLLNLLWTKFDEFVGARRRLDFRNLRAFAEAHGVPASGRFSLRDVDVLLHKIRARAAADSSRSQFETFLLVVTQISSQLSPALTLREAVSQFITQQKA